MEKRKKLLTDLAILRKKAEKSLKKKSLLKGSQLTEFESLKLLHELQVHQIELEMQNEELKLAKELAEVASQKYLELYDFAPSGYFTLSTEGTIIELNLHGSEMLGKTRQNLKKSSFGLFLSEETMPIFNLFLYRIFKNHTKQTCEVSLSGKGNLPIGLHLTGILAENGDQCFINAFDISELRHAVEALRKSEEKNRAIILQTAMDGFWRLDRQGCLLEVNETYCQMSGYSMQELLLMNISGLEVAESAEDTAAHIEKVISNGEDRFETRHRRKDGSIYDVEISTQYQRLQGGGFIAFLHDITERKMAERYREMARKILQILNEPGNIPELIQDVLTVLKTGTGFDAIGIRLAEGDDFPYVSQNGFSRDFLLTENTLIDRSLEGGVCRDQDGKIRLSCTCGLVISGKKDPENPFFTPGGSWWTNDSFPLLEIPPALDARFHPRNKCIHQGYASIALVPIRSKEKIVGLIQLNDLHKDRFNRNTIEKLEGIASHIGTAIMRKNSEETVRESEKRRLAILETAMDGFWLVDMQGRLLEVNETYCRMSGYSAQELRSMHISALEVVEGEAYIAAHLQKVIAKGDDRFETRHRRKDGSTFNIEVSIQYQLAEGGQFVTFMHDITERKMAEENLRQSEERYKILFQGNHSVMLLIDPETGEIKDANPAASRFYGWTPSELRSKNVSEINTLTMQEAKVEMQKAKEEKRNHFFLKHRLANGEFRDVEIFSGPIKFRETTLLYSIIHDITERKQVEEALKDSELMLRKYIDFAPHGIFVVNEKGEYVGVNSAASKITGYSKEELLSMKTTDLVPEEALEGAGNHFKRLVNEGFATEDLLFIRKDKSKGFWTVDAVSLSEKLFLGFVVDITDRKRDEEALKEKERLLRESQAVAHIGSYSADLISKTWKASPEMYEIFGIDETYPHTLDAWVESIHPDFQEELLKELFLGEDKKSHNEQEYKIIRINDGEERWVYGLGKLEYDSERNPVRLIGTIQDITRRKEAEEALLLSNEKIRESVYDLNKAESVAHLGHWKWNIKTGEIIWSDEMYRVFGIDKNTYSGRLGDVITKVIHPDDIHLVHPSKADIFIKQKHIEYRIILPDYSIRHIAAEAGESIVDSIGNPTYLTGIAQDITDRKQAEKALRMLNEELEDRVNDRTAELLKSNIAVRQTEEKYRTVADHTHSWEFWLDRDDHFVYCSPSCERITGYKAVEFLKKPVLLLDIVHPFDLKRFLCHKKKEDRPEGGSHELQFRIIRIDGSTRWIGHECQAIYDESGNFIGTRGSNRDITKRKEIEQLLKTSNEKYMLLSKNITDGIFICREGCFDYVNQAMSLIFGYKEHELNGMKLTQLVKPDYLDDLEIFHPNLHRGNRMKNFESECLKKDESTIFVEFLLNYVAKDRVIYGVVHDITEKKQMQKNIVKAIIQTEESERAYFSKELHDGLGPLLSTIKLYLQWSERPKTNKSREEIIHEAKDILEEALTTVKEISNKLSPHLLTNHGLTSALQSFVDRVEVTSAISVNFESNVDRRLGNDIEAAIYRAVIECINNTLKHAKANNITIMILDSVSQIMIHYSDNGIGFNFEETISMHKGLGLFNLQNRIQSIGGKITLFSQPGKGVDYQIIVNI